MAKKSICWFSYKVRKLQRYLVKNKDVGCSFLSFMGLVCGHFQLHKQIRLVDRMKSRLIWSTKPHILLFQVVEIELQFRSYKRSMRVFSFSFE